MKQLFYPLSVAFGMLCGIYDAFEKAIHPAITGHASKEVSWMWYLVETWLVSLQLEP